MKINVLYTATIIITTFLGLKTQHLLWVVLNLVACDEELFDRPT